MEILSHEISTNDEAGRSFANNLGYAIQNCSAIENLTYAFAAAIDGSHFFDTNLSGKTYKVRRKWVINRLQDVDISDELRDLTTQLWEETTEIMMVRNLIAHNPINRVNVCKESGVEQELLGVVDMTKSTPTNIIWLDATKLSNLANKANNLSERLCGCLEKLQNDLSSCSDT